MNQPTLFQTEPCRLPGYPARWSPCKAYRYTLWRTWTDEPHPPYVAWICLNPSTATESEDDPTLRRVMGFTRAWGYSAMCMLNLFAFRSTDPKAMKAAADAVGDDNDYWLVNIACNAALTVAAWGCHGAHQNRETAVRVLLPDLHCLRLTKDGHPEHPLYLPANLEPIEWRRERVLETTPMEDDCDG